MRTLCLICCVSVLGLAASALGQRCIGPEDGPNGIAKNYGVTPITPEDITWCDDFDSYCDTNCGDCAATNPNPPTTGSIWPGYPPTPDNLCVSPSVSSEYFFRRPYHWPKGPGASSAPGLWPGRWEGWNGNPGWITEPYTVLYQGGGNTNQYHTFALDAAANHKFPGSNALNGTDDAPLTLRFWTTTSWNLYGGVDNWPLYVELRLDDDHAPTDYVERNCAPEAGVFPMVCQQRHLPAGCPPLSPDIHASLAFGWLAQLDTNPCDVETGRKPTAYHAAVFDGNRWTQLFASMFPGQVGKFNYWVNQGYFEMKVKSTTVELKLTAMVYDDNTGDPAVGTSTAIVPRRYVGPFNRVSFGAAPGCKLDPATGECLTAPDAWRYMDGNSGRGWSNGYVDRITLLGGIGSSSTGACCKADGTCTIETATACTAAGGLWRGVNSTCEVDCLGACCQPKAICADTRINECPGVYKGIGTSCATADICPCPTPRVDYDFDADVDMDDFSGLQRCLTTGGGAIPTGCSCFDLNTDGSIDATDVEKFTLCATGGAVDWSTSPECPQ